jgi:hypothetical protein
MDRTKAARHEAHEMPDARQDKRPEEQLPTWRNTRPRGNPETDHPELERSRARMEAVLGR